MLGPKIFLSRLAAPDRQEGMAVQRSDVDGQSLVVERMLLLERILVMGKSSKLLCGFLFAAFAPLAVLAQVPAVAEPPAPKIGEVWKYRTTDMWNNTDLSQYEQELVEIQADRLVFRTKSSKAAEPKTAYYGRGLASCRRMRDSDVEMCDGALAFPLQVGKKNSYDKRPWRNGNGHSSADCEVKAIESVTVPAGTFDAFRIDCDGSWQRVFDRQDTVRGNAGRTEESIWYAPRVNGLVKWTYNSYGFRSKPEAKEQTELIEFVAK